MRNDIQLKTTWAINEIDSELYFDYYNKERKLVGNVIISNQGKITWDIIDLNYIDNIMELINYVMNEECINRLHYESQDEKKSRWNNACNYIFLRSLVVNRRFNYSNNLEQVKQSSRTI